MSRWTQTPFAENPTRAALLLGCRTLLALVLIAHGWEKFSVLGLDAVTAQFTRLGVPVPAVSAFLAAAVELVGGICILFGAFTWVACVAVAVDMLGAYLLVHRGHGVLVDRGGWELVAALGVAAALLAVTSPGEISVDHALDGPDIGRSRRRS
ncbi:DoxX family protein [Arsenicicoccus dermatophilus]|uniref:DoxX family protein n=1 Tax=Arsenicicoccus dermatophilus TaxID=1076331 RepID=UPI001F4D2CD6|nr:DoxX family protein [Arsenicicoccus dermatophilus]MCH8612024.1 DoxX family protein [Arsenicicoccus dermatophilus]